MAMEPPSGEPSPRTRSSQNSHSQAACSWGVRYSRRARSRIRRSLRLSWARKIRLVFDDADLEQAVEWGCVWDFLKHECSCAAGSRIFVQKGIYDKFLGRFTAIENNLAATTGDPFVIGMQHGPQTSQVEFDVQSLVSPLVSHSLEAGSAWVNYAKTVDKAVPFGDHKQSGIGRELGEYALDTYT
ncbi:hypothetical protein E4T56_gene6932 [Termitomyces sp. T112]|nr:hypothetical protein E4T56_gene6932 [Termitomyces sp. T112]